MNPEVKALWIAKLRDRNLKQAQRSLRKDDGFCCLGVLCEVHRLTHPDENLQWVQKGSWLNYLGESAALPGPVMVWAGLTKDYGAFIKIKDYTETLVQINDRGIPFSVIADIIEAQL